MLDTHSERIPASPLRSRLAHLIILAHRRILCRAFVNNLGASRAGIKALLVGLAVASSEIMMGSSLNDSETKKLEEAKQ